MIRKVHVVNLAHCANLFLVLPSELVRFLDHVQMYKKINLPLPAPVTNARLPLNEYDIISSIEYYFKQN